MIGSVGRCACHYGHCLPIAKCWPALASTKSPRSGGPADPLHGQIALSDPNKSGTVTKALEQLIQQQMQSV